MIAATAGPPDVLKPVDLPDPAPGPGQVVVAVRVAAITFIDTQLRAGRSPGPTVVFPVVLGNGIGGVVDAVGAGVDPDWIGVDVIASTGGKGGYATRALASAADLHRVPSGVSLPHATALLADGRTAVGLARAAHIGAGDIVVVTAAAGGVGGLVVQLAKNAGARVVGLVGNDAKLAQIREIGAVFAINYRDADWPEQLDAVAGCGIDIAFDGVGGSTTMPLFDRVRAGGRYVQYGAASGSWVTVDSTTAAQRDVRVVPLSAIGAGPGELFELVESALALASAGDIHPIVGQTYPLEQAADAHAAIEARTTVGKTLLLT
jgi:NADPH2:quinone reductase